MKIKTCEHKPLAKSKEQIAEAKKGLVLVDMFEDNWDAMGFSKYFPMTLACLVIQLAQEIWNR